MSQPSHLHIGLCPTTHKRQYGRKDARNLVKYLKRHPDPSTSVKTCYECKHCTHWHTSSMPPAPAMLRAA